MSTQISASGGSNSSSGGAPETTQTQQNPNVSSTAPAKEGGDSVSLETHRKLLSEKKKVEEQLRSFADKEKKRAEDEARQREDYKTLLAAREAELTAEREEHAKLKNRINSGAKLRSVLEAIDGTVDEAFYGLIPVDKVVLDPETGLPDPMTVKDAVKFFESKYSKVITPKEVILPPSDAAKGAPTGLTYEQWKSLPLDEQKKRMKDVL